MTVNTELSKRIYTGNGVATDYDYDFKIPLAGDLAVSLFDLDGVELPQALNTDYTVTGAGGDNGGKVMFTVPPPSGYTILLLSDASYTQPTDFKNQGRFFPETHENAIDRAVILARQNHEAITRSITLPPQVSGVSTQLPVPQPSTLFGWNSSSNGFENFPLSTIATQIAYGDKNYQVFSGTGAQVNFTLSQNPGSLGNLDVSIDGVTKVPVADYTYVGTTLTFTAAPTNGAVILVRYDQAVPVGTSIATSTAYTPAATGIPTTVGLFLDALWASTGAALINWARTTTGAVTRTVLGKLGDQPVHLLDYVPVAQHAAILNGTSTYDCGPALANAIAAAQANTLSANEVILPKGLINVAQTYTLTAPVRLRGQGGSCAPGYSSFPTVLGTTIKYTGADTNAVLFTFNNVNYGGAGLYNLGLNGNGVARRGLILDAVLGFSSDDLHVTRFTNVLVGLISTGQTTSWNQFKNLYLEGEVDGTAGSTCLWLSGGNGGGGSGSNACHCTFENLHINHGGLRSGIYLGGVDNITFTMTYIFRASGTRPGVEVVHETQGSDVFPIANTFYHLQAGAGGWVEQAGGNATYPTAVIYGYQTDNGQPLPVTNGRRLPYITNNFDIIGVSGIGKSSYGGGWAGSVNATNGSTFTDVTFPGGARSSAAYIVSINAPTTIGYAIQNKTASGFRITWASALPATYSVDWLVLGG